MRLGESTSHAQQLERFHQALGEIADGFVPVAEAIGLSRAELVADASADADAILEPLTPSWREFVEAREAEQMVRLRRMGGEPLAAFLGRFLAATLPAGLGVAVVFVGIRASLGAPMPLAPVWPIVVVALATSIVMAAARRLGGGVTQERQQAAERGYDENLRQAIMAWMRQRTNAAREKSYSTVLGYRGDHKGLAEIDDPSHEIPTGAKERLTKAMEWMPGGAIGISGPRGVGKSTLMRSVCAPGDGEPAQDGEGKPLLATIVDAPVDYDGRDFVLHLFAKLCALVVGEEEVTKMRERQAAWSGLSFASGRFELSWPVLAGSLALFGLYMYSGPTPFASFALAIGGGLLAYWVLVDLGRRVRRRARVERSKSTGDAADVRTATATLQRIWFQQSFSTGWAGTLKVPAGAEGRIEAGSELVEHPMTFPDVVEEFKQFLRQVSRTRRVRIGIDELDKMSDADARRFLNEIKVVFRVPGCFFLISISEDAMSFFERRGLPIRDVFDSSLDDVMHIPQMRFVGSEALIDRRIVDLPLPFVCLLHCISGGLPRDLIRAARDLVEQGKGTPLDRATAKLVGEALDSKIGASKVAARRFESEAHMTLLHAWLERLRSARGSAPALLGVCRAYEAEFLDPVAALPPEDDLRAERRELRSLGTQMVAFAYLAATMLEFFPCFMDRPYVDRALASAEGSLSPVDRLAEVTQTFSADVNTAWEMLSRLRDDLGFERVEFPRPGSVREDPAGDGYVASER